MNEARKNEVLFDSLLKISLADALEEEMAALPPAEELNREYRPSPELDRRIHALIGKRVKRSRFKRIAKRFLQAAACLCVALTVASAVLLSVSATRNAILNAIIQWTEDYSEVKFEDSDINGALYRPAYLPGGYRENAIEKFGNTVMITYANGEGAQIIFSQWPYDAGTALVDSKNTTYKEIRISGQPAYLFEAQTDEDSNTLIWQANGTVFQLISKADGGELKLIAESLKK